MKAAVRYPHVGTLIDDGRLLLVSVIGTGGYGIVYKAMDTQDSVNRFYAVKCLVRSHEHRQAHFREITLHRLASAHPGIIALHRVMEDNVYTYLIMDYAPDQDLFFQILHKRRYLGNDTLIRNIFLQILDAVEHCHSIGIYHRDLKPENFVCFEKGFRIALTDFGLATTQRTSGEFRTGSVYHMSPECQTADSRFGGVYSPESCDIWSLGIVLLNIVTGRNPWKCANQDDPHFESYCSNPYNFLTKILPISSELNDVLVMMLSMEWRARPSIIEIRALISDVHSFYSPDVLFEGNIAKCAWEAGMDLGTRSHMSNVASGSEPDDEGIEEVDDDDDDDTRLFKEQFPLYDDDDSSNDHQQASHPIPESPISRSESSSCPSDPVSPTTPSSCTSSFDHGIVSRPRSPFKSFLNGIQCLFRLCSSSGLHPESKDRLDPRSGNATIDF